MAYASFSDFIAALESAGELRRIKGPFVCLLCVGWWRTKEAPELTVRNIQGLLFRRTPLPPGRIADDVKK